MHTDYVYSVYDSRMLGLHCLLLVVRAWATRAAVSCPHHAWAADTSIFRGAIEQRCLRRCMTWFIGTDHAKAPQCAMMARPKDTMTIRVHSSCRDWSLQYFLSGNTMLWCHAKHSQQRFTTLLGCLPHVIDTTALLPLHTAKCSTGSASKKCSEQLMSWVGSDCGQTGACCQL
jgi:hypothetical protein